MQDITMLVEQQRSFFYSGSTLDYRFRTKQLKALKQMLQRYEQEIYIALKEDLNKSSYEALTTEIGFLHMEIDYTIKHLKEWMELEQADTPITHKGTKNYIQKEPYGVTLVIAPWNYPLHLAIAPTIGAIAAGNTVVMKPSEYTTSTSSLLSKMIYDTFDTNFIAVVEGDAEVSKKLLEQKFDYIFFTGSTAVGKIIMEQASKHLTPVTLELGGKSPVIVDKDANIDLAAKRIVWGKYTNAGQTCVAPDYIYVHEKVKGRLLKAMKKHIKAFYGKQPIQNNDYVRIVSSNHFKRLEAFLTNGTIVVGGDTDKETLIMEPTILDNITWEDPIMQEEIFGPLLPVLTFSTLEEIVDRLKRMDKSLALYYFGEKEKNQHYVFKHISFGGGCINDTLYHLANPHLPFGGVGTSGMGAYHGKYSFETFSHRKSILKQTTKFDIPIRYPGGKIAESILKRVMK
ncbi:aldehyde dehydrogenase family protein [Ornithinibacillus sp. L9]|uniref:Aldehyde dehydrogenase n=1 Tax=Ornithinibacillus caprae TaxID=2678566 RepID=A0A6N8FIP7_9BACI|nr:aldehyde dehydrogenase [Ornithinibacillus caprae]MUK87198.1 aldehyde dehydrogenase family protein [Ornithinibacillus caprae]